MDVWFVKGSACSGSMHMAVLCDRTFAVPGRWRYLEDADQVVGKDVGPASGCEQEALDHAIAVSSEQLH